MKTLIAILIGLFLSLTGFSQSCFPEGIQFWTQDDINDFAIYFPDCTQIEGNVEISGSSSITNLNGLSALTSIGGDLLIDHNSALPNLIGLDNLTAIGGGLTIEWNAVLSSLAGLDNVTFIGGSLEITANDALTNLAGLDNVPSIGLSLSIVDNYSLNSVAGLDNLLSIGGYLIISNNYNLASLASLSNVTSIGSGISISHNPELTSLTGLDNIDPTSIYSLHIRSNTSLSNCAVQSICGYLASPNGVVDVLDNSSGCKNPPEIASDCGITLPCLPFGDYYFTIQADIDNFQINYPECTFLNGYVCIIGDDITNLNGLIVINSTGNDLNISGNPNLTNLTGLSNVVNIGGDLILGGNNTLTNLTGLENLSSIGERLYIGYNDSLTSLIGLDSLNSIGNDLEIAFNPALISLKSLNELTSVGGSLTIENDSLLTSLEGLDSINAGSIDELTIRNNPFLSTCEIQSVCDYLASPNGIIEIHDNAPGCNSQTEVETACGVGLEENSLIDTYVNLYPNPTSTSINIELSQNTIIKNTYLTIYKLNGQKILSQPLATRSMVIDVSGLACGIYCVKLTSDLNVLVYKIVKQ